LASGLAYAVPSVLLAFAFPGPDAPCEDSARVWPRVVVLSPLLSLLAFGVAAFWPASGAGAATAGEAAAASVAGKGAFGLSPLAIPAVAMMATIYLFSFVALIAPHLLTGPVGKSFKVDVSLEPAFPSGGTASQYAGAGGTAQASGAWQRFEGSLDNGSPVHPPAGCTDNDALSTRTDRRLPDADCSRIAERARARLEAGAYLDPELSLRGMAEELGVHPNRLSAAVNRVYGENFCRLVNRYRLEHFAKAVAEGAADRHSLLDLAFDAGFPSKSTFNRLFKEHFGTAPSRYLRPPRGQGDGESE
ncbi:MAG: helix-turn-helix domain-containing protein, partial [Spirochaetia bacterium]